MKNMLDIYIYIFNFNNKQQLVVPLEIIIILIIRFIKIISLVLKVEIWRQLVLKRNEKNCKYQSKMNQKKWKTNHRLPILLLLPPTPLLLPILILQNNGDNCTQNKHTYTKRRSSSYGFTKRMIDINCHRSTSIKLLLLKHSWPEAPVVSLLCAHLTIRCSTIMAS